MSAALAPARAAFDALVKDELPALYRFAKALSGHSPVAEDAVHEAFAALLRELEAGRAVSSPRAWLRVVTRHALARQLRPASRERPAEDLEQIEALASDAGWGASDGDQVWRRFEAQELVRAAFGALDPPDREVLWLVDVDGLSLVEAAETASLSLPAVKSRLHRARLRFMRGVRQLEGDGREGRRAEPEEGR